MELKDWINVGAVALSPWIAVQISVWLADRSEKKKRRLAVFHTLMATRATLLAPEHVKALNTIEIEFYGLKKAKPVHEAWKAYLDHLNSPFTSGDTSGAVWGTKREDLLIDLLQKMAAFLGYDFDRTHLKRTSYFPQMYGDLESEALLLRKSALAVLNGERALHITEQAPTPATPTQAALPAPPQAALPAPRTDKG